MSEENRKDVKFWIGFFIGGFIGAIVLFFLGTKEGKKTGKALESHGRDLLDELLEKLESLERKGKELASEGEAVKDQVIETIAEKKEDFTETTTEKIDSVLAHVEALQERGRQTTADLRKRLTFKNLPRKV